MPIVRSWRHTHRRFPSPVTSFATQLPFERWRHYFKYVVQQPTWHSSVDTLRATWRSRSRHSAALTSKCSGQHMWRHRRHPARTTSSRSSSWATQSRPTVATMDFRHRRDKRHAVTQFQLLVSNSCYIRRRRACLKLKPVLVFSIVIVSISAHLFGALLN